MFFCRCRECENDLFIWGSGTSLVLAGLSIRMWATAHIGRRIPNRVRNRLEKKLVTTGPYSIVRNPLYVANMLALLGFCVVFELLWFLPAAFLYLFVLYSIVVWYEEMKLSQEFGGSHAAYMKRVPRWIPRLEGYRGGIRRIAWRSVIMGEFRSCLSGGLVLILALFKEVCF